MQARHIVAAVSAATAFIIVTATSASAASDTGDGDTWDVECGWWDVYGTVGWNDYEDSDHGIDYDNVVAFDEADDGRSLMVSVYNNTTERFVEKHVKYGNRVSIDTGDLANGSSVRVIATPWDNGEPACNATVLHFQE